MLKLINPIVAKEVGVMAAMVFQHICYWMQTQSVDVVYRSNKELSLDLDEAVSVSQVQRAKQKLLNSGLIKLSRNPFNKFDRTTHYSLTAKGKKLLLSVAVKGKEIVEKSKDVLEKSKQQITKPVNTVKECVNNARTSDSSDVKNEGGTHLHEKPKTSNTSLHEGSRSNESILQQHKKQQEKSQWIPKHLYAKHMKQKRLEQQLNKEPFIPKSMVQGWKDGMIGNPNATKGIPDHLLNNPALVNILKMKCKHINNNV